MTSGKSNGEIVVRESNSLALMPVLDIEEAIQRRAAIVEYTRRLMVEGKDYGAIPGTDKNTLLKPGAEKLNSLFGLAPRFEIVRSEEDWTGERHNGEPFFYYLIRCSLWRGEQRVGEGDGSCNSWEKKYRWRKAERVCPDCGAANIRKSKRGGWYCWDKTGGCGGNFKDNDDRITQQETGNIPNPDIHDLINTILKMAEKRALIAATLIAVNASEFFTQDLEDFADLVPSVVVEPPAPRPVSSGDWNVPCQDCGGGIESWNDHTPRAVAETRRKRYGRALCEKCAKAEKERLQAAKEEDAIEGQYREAEKAAVS